jgi:DNA-binding LacI/PurR family transcriptional regulator
VDSDELAARTDRIPMVLLGERIAGTADHVVIDNIEAARQAVSHLAGLGRTRIAAVGAQYSKMGETARLRLAGYKSALADAGLPFRPELVAETPSFHRHDGAAAITRLIDAGARPDAVFAFNDLTAIGVLRACYDRGIQVPEDVAVIGFDDLEEGRYAVPALSTISPDKDFIGQTAVGLLVERLAHSAQGGSPAKQVIAPYRLEARESTMGRGKR